jgi:hypothetical protein
MLHRSIIDQFLVKSVSEGKALAEISLKDLVSDEEFKKMATESFEILSGGASLAEAKALMDKISACSDVFVTENGKKNSRVIGWVTNVIVMSHSNL